MKKVILLIFAVFLVFSLSGCGVKRKATSSGSDSSGATASVTAQASLTAVGSPGVQVQTSVTPTSDTESVSVADLNKTYLENFQKAADSANASLKNTAIFCTASIEYPVKDLISSATQTFFFSSDNAGVKDWFWVVQFDPLENSKKDFFAAKRNYPALVCTKFAKEQPKISYADAMAKIQESNALTAMDSVDAAKMKISLAEEAWKIDVWSVNGQIMSSRLVNATNGYIDINAIASPTAASPSL